MVLPAPITGPSILCATLTITLSDATAGGVWTSSNTSFATVGAGTGIVTGVSASAATITYTLPNGCFVTKYITVSPPCGVGIKEINATHSVALYPSPAYDELIINAEAGAYTSYVITNQLGQVVLRNTINSEQTSVNVKSLPSGMYHVSLKGDVESTVMKFIKQ